MEFPPFKIEFLRSIKFKDASKVGLVAYLRSYEGGGPGFDKVDRLIWEELGNFFKDLNWEPSMKIIKRDPVQMEALRRNTWEAYESHVELMLHFVIYDQMTLTPQPSTSMVPISVFYTTTDRGLDSYSAFPPEPSRLLKFDGLLTTEEQPMLGGIAVIPRYSKS